MLKLANNIITNFAITELGTQLLTRGLAEGKAIVFTNALLGDGICTVDPKSVTALKGNTMFSVIPTTSYNVQTGITTFSMAISNLDFTSPKLVTEFGFYAKLAGDASDVLFAYKNSKNTPFILKAYSGSETKATLTADLVIQSAYNASQQNAISDANGANIDDNYLLKTLNGVLGVPQISFCNDLPDATGAWGWMDGGEIKKSDYPDLWLRVKPEVDLAVANIAGGTWEYKGSNNLKSYFGWYKGTTEDYFRKPDVMSAEMFMRATGSLTCCRLSGVHQVNSVNSHRHTASTGTSGSHNHTGTTSTDGNHTHTINYGRALRGGSGGSNLWQNDGNYATFNAAGAHQHTFTASTDAGHVHTITLTNTGGTETTPPNVAVKVYALLRL